VVLSTLAVVLSILALGCAAFALRRSAPGTGGSLDDLPSDVPGLRSEVQALRIEAKNALKHLAVVRYDAFGDMGGHLSWSLPLLATPVVTLLYAARAYKHANDNRATMSSLFDAARGSHQASTSHEILAILLDNTRAMLHAECTAPRRG